MSYSPPNSNNWQGRKTELAKGKQYWYQHVELLGISELSEGQTPDFGIVGYVCDEGVRRNQGRVGAKDGPGAIRQKAGKMALHTIKRIADFGDVVCEDETMEACQDQLSGVVSKLIKAGTFPIVLGGGHDIAYGHFKGIKEAVGDKRVGIINFDAHFDLRPIEDKPNSGTPFNQILMEHSDQVEYLVLGIQQAANTRELYEIADHFGVEYVLREDCDLFNLETIEQIVYEFAEKVDVLYVTVDMDGFSSAYAPGVSAPSAVGFAPDFFFNTLESIFKTGKVISLDIAEMNPVYDRDGVTAGLAARIMEKVADR